MEISRSRASDQTRRRCAEPPAAVSEKERLLTAIHEGGHVLVARHTAGATPMEKATIVPHGAAGGVTLLEAPDDGMVSQQQLLAKQLADVTNVSSQ